MKTIKEKTAIASIILKILFTILKFTAVFFTGSLAILAEAWHSFTDIITSILVYISVCENSINHKENHPSNEKNNQEQNKYKNLFTRHLSQIITNIKNILAKINLETSVAFLIGILLLLVSLGLFKNAVFFIPSMISNSLLTGIIFILFAICSFIIAKFETSVGEKEHSAALISDGTHSRADTASSLLAGFSLIIYNMGINIDRLAAFIIAFFIFLSALEILINIFANKNKVDSKNIESSYSYRYRMFDIILLAFKKDTWMKFYEFIDNKFKLNLKETELDRKIIFYLKSILVAVFLLCYFMTSFFSIKSYEQGIIERLGKPLEEKGAIEPGLHCKLPWPIDKVIKINSKVIQHINVGNITDRNTSALIWTRPHGTEKAFLSGDNNFFYPYLVVHYKVKDIFKYTYKCKNPQELLNNTAYRTITNIFSKKTFYEIASSYRTQFMQDTIKLIQKELDFFESGLEIITINIKDVHPPIFIADSFEDVIAAYQDKQRMINEAIGYKNSALPVARAQAVEKIQQSESYVIDRINRAQGEGIRFKSQQEAYIMNKEVTYIRSYLNNMNQGLQNNYKIIIDPDSGTPEVWLDFDKKYTFWK